MKCVFFVDQLNVCPNILSLPMHHEMYRRFLPVFSVSLETLVCILFNQSCTTTCQFASKNQTAHDYLICFKTKVNTPLLENSFALLPHVDDNFATTSKLIKATFFQSSRAAVKRAVGALLLFGSISRVICSAVVTDGSVQKQDRTRRGEYQHARDYSTHLTHSA